MTAVTVCVLCDGDWASAGRALASAARFGLAAVVGVTAATAPPAGVAAYPVQWRDDFADARNQLLDRIDAPWLLWLDADEELVAWMPPDLHAIAADILGVWIEDRPDLTPRPIVRLHRRATGVRWRGALHEMLTSAIEGDPPIVDGCLIRHHGYTDDVVVAAKCARNHRIAAAALARGEQDYALVLEQARWASARGEGAFAAWLAAFNHQGAAPDGPGGLDRRVEAAAALCALGYPTPAELVLRDNGGIVSLRLALIGAGDPVDEDALAALADDLAAGRYDRRYAMPAGLVGADATALRRWLRP